MGYAGQNPLRFVDWNGLAEQSGQSEGGEGQQATISFTGSEKEFSAVLGYMQQLTNDTLGYKCKKGGFLAGNTYQIYIEEQNSDEGKECGTALIRELLTTKSDFTNINIETTSLTSSADHEGNSIKIKLGKDPVSVPTLDKDGKTESLKEVDKSIELGHELIHALHMLQNVSEFDNANVYSENKIMVGEMEWTSNLSPEELRTVGLPFNQKNAKNPKEKITKSYITENKLRLEQGFDLRSNY